MKPAGVLRLRSLIALALRALDPLADLELSTGPILMMRFQTIVRAALTAVLVATATPVLADEPAAREIREAKTIFRVLVPATKAAQPCGLDPDWQGQELGIPADAIELYLGIQTKYEIKPPHPKVNLPRLLALVGPENFCDREVKEAFVKAKFESASETLLDIRRLAYTFPVFNKKHTRAIVLVTDESEHWRRAGESLEHLHGDARGDIVVLEKAHGIWKRIKSIPHWST